MSEESRGLPERLVRELMQEQAARRFTETECLLIGYLIAYDRVAPRYLAWEEWLAFAQQQPGDGRITERVLRNNTNDLVQRGIVCRDRDGNRAGVALDPAWRYQRQHDDPPAPSGE